MPVPNQHRIWRGVWYTQTMWLLVSVALCALACWRGHQVLFRASTPHQPGIPGSERMLWWLLSCSAVGLLAVFRGLARPTRPAHSFRFHMFNETARGVVHFGQRALWSNPVNYSAVRNVFNCVGRWRLSSRCSALEVSTEPVTCTPRSGRPSMLMQTTGTGPAQRRGETVWVVYFHGGGYVSGSPLTVLDGVAHLLQAIEERSSGAVQARALIVSYALAPEHPYPAALDDAVAAYRCLIREHSVSASRICLAGDSGGGGLALTSALRLQQLDLPAPGCVYCLSPFLDLRWEDVVYAPECVAADCIQPLLARGCARSYLCGYGNHKRQPAGYADGLASPVLAPDDLLRGLPPTLLQTGQLEIFRDEARRLHARCARLFEDGAAAPLQMSEWADMTHCFQLQGRQTPVAQHGLREGADFVLKHISASGLSSR